MRPLLVESAMGTERRATSVSSAMYAVVVGLREAIRESDAAIDADALLTFLHRGGIDGPDVGAVELHVGFAAVGFHVGALGEIDGDDDLRIVGLTVPSSDAHDGAVRAFADRIGGEVGAEGVRIEAAERGEHSTERVVRAAIAVALLRAGIGRSDARLRLRARAGSIDVEADGRRGSDRRPWWSRRRGTRRWQ